MARSRSVDSRAWDDLLRPMAMKMIVGATISDPGVFPEYLGIGRRDAPRNEYLGLVVTRPDENILVFGLNYYDQDDGCDNEDIFKVDLASKELTPYKPSAFEQEYPEYAGYHWAAKPYLRKR